MSNISDFSPAQLRDYYDPLELARKCLEQLKEIERLTAEVKRKERMTEIIWCQTCKRYYPKSDPACPYCEIERLTAEVKELRECGLSQHDLYTMAIKTIKEQVERAERYEVRIKELESKLSESQRLHSICLQAAAADDAEIELLHIRISELEVVKQELEATLEEKEAIIQGAFK